MFVCCRWWCCAARNMKTTFAQSFDRNFLKWFISLMIIMQLSSKHQVNAMFNLYLDRREFQKLHGISSNIYYVQEGVVNEYALNFVVPVPPEVDDLHFTWQALTKKPIHYDMSYDYTDFFALSQPYSNISSVGRVPQNLETFKVTLPCSGRSNSEVPVTIRMNFHTKYPKPNTTSITIKRNKICLFKEMTSSAPAMVPDLFAPNTVDTVQQGKNQHHQSTQQNADPTLNSTLLFQDPGPSLLLAGLLGGCAVTASVVFLTFFICLKRKLMNASLGNSQHRSAPLYPCHEPNLSSNNSSPACLLRQSNMASTIVSGTTGIGTKTSNSDDNHLWKHFASTAEKSGGTILSQSGSHNSYVTVASFWNDLFSSSTPANCRMAKISSNSLANGSNRGSDVSPYAYAHIVPKGAPMEAPPVPKNVSLPPPPTLIEWYSQSVCPNGLSGSTTTNSNISNNTNKVIDNGSSGHIYANNLYSFAPKYNPPSKFSTNSSQIGNDTEDDGENDRPDNRSATLRSGSESLIQIDGFQCRRNFTREANVVERFL